MPAVAEPRTQRSGVSGNRGEPIVTAYSAPLRARLSRIAGASFFSAVQAQLTHLEVDALLDGVRVVDVSRVLAGPYAGQVMAEMSADVIKVEGPEGDPARAIGALS